MSSRCLRFQVMFRPFPASLRPRRLLPESALDSFAGRGGHIFADKIRLDRQFAMAAVNQHGQLNSFGRGQNRSSASSAARVVRPLNSTSSTSMTVLPVTSKGMTVGCIFGAAWRSRSSRCMATSRVPTGTGWFQMELQRCRPGAGPEKRRRAGCRPAPLRRCFHCARRFRARCGSGRGASPRRPELRWNGALHPPEPAPDSWIVFHALATSLDRV